MGNKLACFLRKNYERIFIGFNTVLTIIIAIYSNYLYSSLVDVSQKESGFQLDSLFFIFISIIIVVLLIFVLDYLKAYIREKLFADFVDEKNIKQAYSSVRNLSFKQLELFQNSLDSDHQDVPLNVMLMKLHCENINYIVEQCYEYLTNVYTTRGELIHDICFEVTFMTLSYFDSEITIPASCNKERRSPISMIERKKNINVYKNTVTASIYKVFEKNERPEMQIIENTVPKQNSDTKYAFIYNGQENRIKSSVVLPILSHKNELLGTLVAHCDKSDFFLNKKRRFWQEILELFAVEIAKEKYLIDKMLVSEFDLEKPF